MAQQEQVEWSFWWQMMHPQTPIGSLRRYTAICAMLLTNHPGGFIIIHQDACKCMETQKQEDCNCVADVIKVERGRS